MSERTDAEIEAAAKAIYPILQDILNGRVLRISSADVPEFALARAALAAADAVAPPDARIEALEAALRTIDAKRHEYVAGDVSWGCRTALHECSDIARVGLYGEEAMAGIKRQYNTEAEVDAAIAAIKGDPHA